MGIWAGLFCGGLEKFPEKIFENKKSTGVF
jgi:hypothetical protein